VRGAAQHATADILAEVAAVEHSLTVRGISRPAAPDVAADLAKLASMRPSSCVQ
jgi:hypothetical protein